MSKDEPFIVKPIEIMIVFQQKQCYKISAQELSLPIIDSSALIAVIVDEPERTKMIEYTSGNTLIGPGSIPWEIGNALSVMFKQDRLTLDEAQQGISIFESISLRYVETVGPHP